MVEVMPNRPYLPGAADTGIAVSKRSQPDGSDGSSVINPGAIASMTARMCLDTN